MTAGSNELELTRVKRAARNKRRAEEGLRAAILEAHDAGASLAAIAEAAGITRGAVWQRIRRDEASRET